jgi:type I restriction enzyme S subunit
VEVRPGYKRTEVGVIPEDWDCKPLENLIAPDTTITYGIVQAGPHIEDGIPYIKTGDMSGDSLPTEGLARTSPKIALGYPRSRVRAGELVYSIRASVGSVHRVPFELDGANLTQGTARIAPNRNTDAEFLLWALRSHPCQNWVNSRTKGTTYKEITLATLRHVPVPFPPLPEQRAIAEVLSDVDALIAALDRLIAKKRAIKQGAMQQLLTGKTRLPGFSGEWEVKRLGDAVDFLDEKRKPIKDSVRAKMSGQFPYYGASGIIDYVNGYIFDEELVLLAEDGDNILSRNSRIAFRVSGKIWVNNHAHVLRPKPNTNIEFLTEYLESLDYAQYNTGTAQPKLNKKGCVEIPVSLPPLPEQRAIAAVLSDMDAEIAALEARREKTRALKQGVMQELLTGRIRLV